MIIQHSKKNPNWATPSYIIEPSINTLGGIDLDPASDERANSLVKAPRIFTIQDDGLKQNWYGKVFLNPPGGKTLTKPRKSNVKAFWNKLQKEFIEGRTTKAIWVGYNLSQLKYLPEVLKYPVCILYKRIAFLDDNLVQGKSPSHDNFITLISTDPVDHYVFHQEFSPLGEVGLFTKIM